MNTILHYRTKDSISAIVGRMKRKCHVTENLEDAVKGVLIRYGHSGYGDADVVYNTANAIACCAADKIEARSLMLDAGVTVPDCILPHHAVTKDALKGVWISRPRFHTRGQSFIVIRNDAKKARAHLRSDRYLSRIFRKTGELRIHCGHGRVILIHDKNTGSALNSNTCTKDWTVLNWEDYDLGMCKDALAAVECLGLDFGAVDVIVRKDKWAILEVNTAPCVPGEVGPRKYAFYFDWLFSSKKKRQHFEWKDAKKVEDIVWRS